MASEWEQVRAYGQALVDLANAQLAKPPPPPQPNVPPLAWGAKVSPLFRERVRLTGRDFSLDPNWLMAVMAFETVRTFSPSIKNPSSTATGLLQFLETTAQELGTSTAELAAMTAEKQFDYVWLYYRNRISQHGPILSLGDCYMAVLNPAAMGQPDGYVMWVSGSSAYAVNAGLDTDQNHQITKAEAVAKVAATLAEGLQPANAAV